jgi:hypothetical protein
MVKFTENNGDFFFASSCLLHILPGERLQLASQLFQILCTPIVSSFKPRVLVLECLTIKIHHDNPKNKQTWKLKTKQYIFLCDSTLPCNNHIIIHHFNPSALIIEFDNKITLLSTSTTINLCEFSHLVSSTWLAGKRTI